jgi:hypothetical protein
MFDTTGVFDLQLVATAGGSTWNGNACPTCHTVHWCTHCDGDTLTRLTPLLPSSPGQLPWLLPPARPWHLPGGTEPPSQRQQQLLRPAG